MPSPRTCNHLPPPEGGSSLRRRANPVALRTCRRAHLTRSPRSPRLLRGGHTPLPRPHPRLGVSGSFFGFFFGGEGDQGNRCLAITERGEAASQAPRLPTSRCMRADRAPQRQGAHRAGTVLRVSRGSLTGVLTSHVRDEGRSWPEATPHVPRSVRTVGFVEK